jgi:hypothetical protein
MRHRDVKCPVSGWFADLSRLAMGDIYRLSIRCPVTSNKIDTGIQASTREALSSAIYLDGMVYCKYCHSLHAYSDNASIERAGRRFPGDYWRPNP